MPRPHCLSVRAPLAAAVVALVGLTPAAPTQDQAPTAAEVPSTTLLARLKARTLTLDDARPLVDELAARPTRVRLQAAEAVATQLGRHAKTAETAIAAATDLVERAAEQRQKQLLGAKGEARVEALRGEALAASRRQDLAKDTIATEIDPRVDELRGLLLPTLEDLDGDALAAAIATARERHAELREWHALYVHLAAGFEGHEDADRWFAKHPPPPHPGPPSAVDDAARAAAFAGLPMSAQDQKALAANEAARPRIDAEEWLGTLELNRLRYVLGLPLLLIDEKLADAARDHSQDMQRLGFFSHTSPIDEKRTPGQRAANFGTSGGAENIAAGQSTGHGAIRAWWYSPGHHKNMLGGHRRTGLGRCEQLWTQMFGG